MTPTNLEELKRAAEASYRPPFGDQQFDTHQQWVDHAHSWLTCHDDYNNTEHGGGEGWRGHHFTALCFDSKGRRCRNGGDIRRARDEGAFPVWWIWPDQITALLAENDRLRSELEAERERRESAEDALMPFADAPDLEGSWFDDEPLSGYWADVSNDHSKSNAVTFGHLRAARAHFQSQEASNGE